MNHLVYHKTDPIKIKRNLITGSVFSNTIMCLTFQNLKGDLMNNYKFYTILFLIITIVATAPICYANGVNIDLIEFEIGLMESVIEATEQYITELMASIMITEDTIDQIYLDLSSLSMSIGQTDMFLVDARQRLAEADDDAERAEWQAVIDNLESYRSELADEYTIQTVSGDFYSGQLIIINNMLEEVRVHLEWAEAELQRLQDLLEEAQQNN